MSAVAVVFVDQLEEMEQESYRFPSLYHLNNWLKTIWKCRNCSLKQRNLLILQKNTHQRYHYTANYSC